MFKSPRRNGRNKGFKIKHVIQISMLLGVSMWLLYQIHQSDDKKPSVTIRNSDKLDNDSSREFVKLGRKDLRPRVKGTKAEDEQKDETEGLEDVAEDHESDELEEVGENEHADGKEDSEEMKEHENDNENEKDDDDKGREHIGMVQVKESEDGNKRNEQNKVVVVEDGGDDRSVRGEVENNKMMNNGENEIVEGDTSNGKQPSVDHNEHSSKVQTAQQIASAPDSYSFETNTANNMKSTRNDENMKADSRSEAQSKIGESEQKDDASIHEEEKDVLTDLETLPENGI